MGTQDLKREYFIVIHAETRAPYLVTSVRGNAFGVRDSYIRANQGGEQFTVLRVTGVEELKNK